MDRYDPMVAPEPAVWLALDESERALLVEDYHSEAGAELPNLPLHVGVHVIVENQVAMGTATRTAATLERLQREGLDRHDAIHAVGTVLADFLFSFLRRTGLDGHPAAELDDQIDALSAAAWLARAEEQDEETSQVGEVIPERLIWQGMNPRS